MSMPDDDALRLEDSELDDDLSGAKADMPLEIAMLRDYRPIAAVADEPELQPVLTHARRSVAVLTSSVRKISQDTAQHGPLRVADTCELIRQAALSVDFLSRPGFVHRDLKPLNLMLFGSPATVTVLDLRLASDRGVDCAFRTNTIAANHWHARLSVPGTSSRSPGNRCSLGQLAKTTFHLLYLSGESAMSTAFSPHFPSRCRPVLLNPCVLIAVGTWLACLAGALATPIAGQAFGAELTPAERKFLARLSAGVSVGSKLLLPPDPNLVELDALAESGPADLRKAASLDLISWAMARKLSTSAEAAWKAAEDQGRNEIYMKWLERAALHFDTNYRNYFPFPLNDFVVGRPQAGDFLRKCKPTSSRINV